MPRRVCVGVVTSDKMAKTRVVEIPRLVKHPRYGQVRPAENGVLRA